MSMNHFLDFYVESSRRHLDIEAELRRRIEHWLLSEEDLERKERVFFIHGVFGSGKTWLLTLIEASSQNLTHFSRPLPPSRYRALYIDLKHCHKKGFIRTTKQAVDRAWDSCRLTQQKLCLCVDHIPGRLSEEIEEMESMVLSPALKDYKAFLVMAQELREPVGLSGLIPVVKSFCLTQFEEKGIEELCQYQNYDGDLTKIINYSARHPYLATLLVSGKTKEEAMRQFLLEYLEDRGYQWDDIMNNAFPLSLVPSYKHPNHIALGRKALTIYTKRMISSQEWDKVLTELIELGWMYPYGYNVNGKYEYESDWEQVVQKCVACVFQQQQPEIWRQVKQALESEGEIR